MSSNSSCLIIAGERSGEDHALSFFSDLKKKLPNTDFFGVGGDRLKSQGLELIYHLKDFSGIGISEVVQKIPFYYKAVNRLLKEVDRRKTKSAILIDFQGFNLKLAKKLKKKNVNVLYYVAPQAWVWKAYRARVLEKNVHTLFTILPFEKKWFEDRGVTRVKSVVHPLMNTYASDLKEIPERSLVLPYTGEDISGTLKRSTGQKNKLKILLLPGSRRVEVETLLPIFKSGLCLVEEKGFAIETGLVKVDSLSENSRNLYDEIQADRTWDAKELKEAINWADMCIAASGTVTLTTGLFELPTVVVYKLSLVTQFILNLFLRYDGPISLTNIILGKNVFPEFIQHEANRYNISKSILYWANNQEAYKATIRELARTKQMLYGDDFSLSDYLADVINS